MALIEAKHLAGQDWRDGEEETANPRELWRREARCSRSTERLDDFQPPQSSNQQRTAARNGMENLSRGLTVLRLGA